MADELYHTECDCCEHAQGIVDFLRAQIREPLTDEGWMFACIEARQERDRLRTQLALKDKALEKIPSLIPTNWLDSLLTGPDAVRLSCPNGEVETLLLAVKARIEKHIAQSLSPSMTDAK